MLEYRLLGPLEVGRDGTPVALGGPRQQAVLAVLLLGANRPISTDALIDGVWGDHPPASAATTLHGYVFHLRRALDPERSPGEPSTVLLSTPNGYRLDAPPDAIDAVRFERLADHGRRLLRAGDAPGAASALGDALALWRDTPLGALTDLDAVRTEAARLTERRMGAVEDLGDALLASGQTSAALDLVDAVLVDEPWREHLWVQRLLGLYRSGRQADALAAFGEIRRRMVDELGLDPGPELRDMEARILTQDPSLELPPPVGSAPSAVGRRSLPAPVTRFVGRPEDVERVDQAMRSARLVTIIGPGGVGKTRLAVEVLRNSAAEVDTVWFVDLGVVDRPELVDGAIAATVTGAAGAALDDAVGAVGDRSGVVVLDNCEHVVDAVAVATSTLVSACPRLTVLATSREALAVDGEHLVALAPLATPPPGSAADDAATVLACPAVELFVDRIRTHDRSFDPAAHLGEVVEICVALDGIPLALELAAARLRTLPLDELSARIEDRFRLLTGGSRARVSRQQTLEATITWSHDLLDHRERVAFARLSVFSGGFVVGAAESVLSGEPLERRDVVDLLGQLVDKSLLALGPRTGRYRMLETIRHYAAQRLAAAPADAEITRRRHAEWCVAFVEARADRLVEGSDPAAVEAVDAEAANLRGAIAWATESGEAELALDLAAAMGPWWELRGLLAEGRIALEQVLSTDVRRSPSRELATLALGFIARRQGDHPTAEHHTRVALEALRAHGDAGHLAHALGRMAWVELGRGDSARAAALAQEGLELAEGLDRDHVTPWMQLALGHAAHHDGDPDRAQQHFERARAGFDAAGSTTGLVRSLFHLAQLRLERGDGRGAARVAGTAVEVAWAGHDEHGLLMATEVVALSAAVAGDHVTAVVLASATGAARQAAGAHDTGGLDGLDTLRSEARGHLGPEAFDEAVASGGSLDAATTVDLALRWTRSQSGEGR